MEFLMFVCTDTAPDAVKEKEGEIDVWLEEGERRGIRKQGDALEPSSTARTVRVRNGETLVTDGPFAESKEWIVGYDLLDCKDIAEAVDYASRHPMARAGRIEVRQVMVWED
jgi:hypothetical protein